MGRDAVAEAFEAIDAALAVVRGEVAKAACGAPAANDPLAAGADECLDILAGLARTEARVAALKAEAVATFAESARSIAPPDIPVQAQEMAIAAEVGCLLAIGDRAAGALLAQSYALTTSLPRTMEALKAGTMSWQHARVMVEEAATLNPDAATALEAHFLDPDAPDAARGCPAGEMPAYRLRRKARVWRERNHPDSIEIRHAKSVTERCLEFAPEQDGMARLSAYLPADKATAIWNRYTAIARGFQGPNEERTLTQLRADLFAATALRGGSGCTGCCGGSAGTDDAGTASKGLADIPVPRAEVLVTVPVFSLLGATDEPAMLDGYGPIPAAMARDLVANGAASFYRVLVDPRDGAPLEIGRTSYRLTKAMRTWLRLRDGKCPFPGCNNNSLDNEADHLLAWHQGGTTGISNLGQPCPKHHRLRHTSRWRPTAASKNEPPGWVSPSGRNYKSEHQDWEPPKLPSPPQARAGIPAQPGSNSMMPAGKGTVDYFRLPRSLGEDCLAAYLAAR